MSIIEPITDIPIDTQGDFFKQLDSKEAITIPPDRLTGGIEVADYSDFDKIIDGINLCWMIIEED